jgi:hypothetical protein
LNKKNTGDFCAAFFLFGELVCELGLFSGRSFVSRRQIGAYYISSQVAVTSAKIPLIRSCSSLNRISRRMKPLSPMPLFLY